MAKAVFAQRCEASPQFWGEVPTFCSLSVLSFAVKTEILVAAPSFQRRFLLSNSFLY